MNSTMEILLEELNIVRDNINTLEPRLKSTLSQCKNINQAVDTITMKILSEENCDVRVDLLRRIVKSFGEDLKSLSKSIQELNIGEVFPRIESPSPVFEEPILPPTPQPPPTIDEENEDEEEDDDLPPRVVTPIPPTIDLCGDDDDDEEEENRAEENAIDYFDLYNIVRSNDVATEEEVKFLQEKYTCVACFEEHDAVKMAFPACSPKHANCIKCTSQMVIKRCPMCRTEMLRCSVYTKIVGGGGGYNKHKMYVGPEDFVTIENDPFYADSDEEEFEEEQDDEEDDVETENESVFSFHHHVRTTRRSSVDSMETEADISFEETNRTRSRPNILRSSRRHRHSSSSSHRYRAY